MYHTPHKKKKYFRRELSVIIFLYKSKAFLCCFFKKSFIYLCIIFGCAESPLLCGLFPFVASGGRSVVAVASLVEGGLRGIPHQHVFSCGGRAPRHAASARVLLWRAGSEACRISTCGTWTQLLCDTWDLPRSGVKPVSPALAGGFSTTELPGKSLCLFRKDTYTCMYTYTHTHTHSAIY